MPIYSNNYLFRILAVPHIIIITANHTVSISYDYCTVFISISETKLLNMTVFDTPIMIITSRTVNRGWLVALDVE